MNHSSEGCLQHTTHPYSKDTSASTLYDNLQPQSFVKSCDSFPYDIPSPIELQSPDLSPHRQYTSTKVFSLGWPSYKRRKSGPDPHTAGFLRGQQPRLEELHPGPRHRSFSLARGGDFYNAWTAETFQHDPAVLPEEDVLKSDPEDIALLWELVTMPSSRIPQPIDPSVSVSEKGLKAPSPCGKTFGQRVLEPRSIVINERLHSMKAYKHFDVNQAVGDRVRYYTEDRKAANSAVWLDVEEAFVQDIAREYTCMERRTLCEAEFASYARETLLKRHRRVLDLDQGEHERVWLPERMIELVAKPTAKMWKCPPLVGKYAKAGDTPYSNYEFDLRPDCAYWLSLQAVDSEYRTQVREYIFIVNKTITCPYLTIEFKKDDSAEQVAWNQVAGAAAVALYNRFLLRQRMLEETKQDWDIQQHFGPLRHYGMTFTGSCYKIWSIRPTVTKKGQWSGCRMDVLHQGDCVSPAGVRDLIDWINEIHCWGLTEHGPECYKDVKLCFKAREDSSGIRVLDVTSFIVADDSTEG